MRVSWKHMRTITFIDKDGREQKGFTHTHNPVEDALGNAHALLYMINEEAVSKRQSLFFLVMQRFWEIRSPML